MAFLGLWLASTAALATDYTFSGALNGATFPKCTSYNGWQVSGTTYTCGDAVSLASGDRIVPTTSITVVANDGITLAGNNTVGGAGVPVNLQANWGTGITVNGSGNTLYGNLTSTSGKITVNNASVTGTVTSSSGAITLSSVVVSGSLNTNGTVTLTSGSVTGNVTGNNGVTTTNGTVIGGNVVANSGSIDLAGGSVAGSVHSDCCTIKTSYTNVSKGISSGGTSGYGSNGSWIWITGGTISGDISTSGGSPYGIVIDSAVVTAGSIKATNVPIVISDSTIGSPDSRVNITGNNWDWLLSNTTVYGDVTAGNWYSALSVDDTSQVFGTCSPDSPRCNRSELMTNDASALTATTARLNGTVKSSGLNTALSFEYGPTTAYGSTASATPGMVAGGTVDSTAFYADLVGLACNTTYHFRAKGVNFRGAVYGADRTFTTGACPAFCKPPSNIPSDVGAVSCVCDTFDRAAINPSTIFDGSWALSNSDKISNPYIANGRLRLTENTQDNAKAATAPGFFPAAGNYISVEFNHYAYDAKGTAGGADGVAVTLSDYSIPAVPGAFGGSLGYAQKGYGSKVSDCKVATGCPGFAGGWIGVGLDEFGNYEAAAEGRVGGFSTSAQSQSIGLRGPGSVQNGYRWIGGAINAGAISDGGTKPAPGAMYQVIVDSRKSGSGEINVTVNRDSVNKNGSSYATLYGPFNVFGEAQAAKDAGWIAKIIPDYWKVSFTGSTGDYTNIHEIDSLRVCAQRVYPSTNGVASGFSAIDSAYPATATGAPAFQTFQTGDIYMKVAGKPFELWIGALMSNAATSGLAVDYAKTAIKYVQVKLVDNSQNVCGSDSARLCTESCTGKTEVETAAKKVAVFAKGNSSGATVSPSFTLNSAYRNLVAVMKECTDANCSAFTSTAAACSADSFSVRPENFTAVTSGNADSTKHTPRAGSAFELKATVPVVGYLGKPKINSAALSAVSPATVVGPLAGEFSNATSAGSLSTATGTVFAYDEVGSFKLLKPDFSMNPPRIPGVYDDDWSEVDSGPDGDCVTGKGADAYANTKNGDGKYGCNFGISDDTAAFGRFIPGYFVVIPTPVFTPACPAGGFSYMGQAFTLSATIEARTVNGVLTKNYTGALARGVVGVQLENADNGVRIDSARLGGVGGAWVAGRYDFVASQFTRAATPDGSYDALDIGLSVTDSDASPSNPGPYLAVRDMDASSTACIADSTGLSTAAGVCTATKIVSGAKLRFGRLRLSNAFGSDRRNLRVPVEAQYWSGLSWVRNAQDSCTTLPVAAIKLSGKQGNTKVVSEVKLSSGSGNIELTCPYATCPLTSKPATPLIGRVDVCVDLKDNDPTPGVACSASSADLPYLQGKWPPGTSYANDPAATATFGVYSPETRKTVHIRELF